MAPIRLLDPFAWPRSMATRLSLEAVGDRRAADAGRRWPTPGVDDPSSVGQGAHPPSGYVISFIPLHKRGFNTPASMFMRGLCHVDS
jgi:hypothetical protein